MKRERDDCTWEKQPSIHYDEIPYVSHPFPQSHPCRLASVARLFGIEPASLDTCRVLELGCSSGGNLIPMADQLPNSQFVGIDASAVEIAQGRKLLEAVGLENVALEQLDLRKVGAEFGQFNFIIAHGVYSWVSDDVQKSLLRVCKENLAPNGIGHFNGTGLNTADVVNEWKWTIGAMHTENDLATTIRGNRLLEDDAYQYTYDDEGNLIRRDDKSDSSYSTYAWDTRNRLTTVT